MSETTDPTDLHLKAADYRRRILTGENLSAEEFRDAITTMRTIRRQRSDAKASKAKGGGAATMDMDSILNMEI